MFVRRAGDLLNNDKKISGVLVILVVLMVNISTLRVTEASALQHYEFKEAEAVI